MREIKFRRWKHGFMDYEPHVNGYINHFLNKDDGSVWMQFTGWVDKNGNDIYQGDVIRRKNLFQDFGTQRNGFSYDYIIWSDFRGDVYRSERYEVIGNIYENPELELKHSTADDIEWEPDKAVVVIGNICENPELATKEEE